MMMASGLLPKEKRRDVSVTREERKEETIEVVRSDDPRFGAMHIPLRAKTKKDKDGAQ